jgi:hypothetical protein
MNCEDFDDETNINIINLNTSNLSPLAIALKQELDAGKPLVSIRVSKDDDDADDRKDNDRKDDDEVPFHCTLESIVGGSPIACHDPTGCSDSDDETEWCYVSDVEQPASFAIKNQGLFQSLDTSSPLAKTGKRPE